MHGLMMDYPLTIDRILEHANRMFPTKKVKTKLPDGSMHEYTYADLYKRSKQLGNVLGELGIGPGDRVGTFAWNNYQHVEFYFGIPGAGAVCHTLNIRLSAEQLAYIINHAEDKVIFIDATLLKLFEQAADMIEVNPTYVLFGASDDVKTKLPDVKHYEDLMQNASAEFSWKANNENMAMGLCYTSGTTGDPKGALYSHRSMYLHTMGENQASALGLTEADSVLAVVPQFHAMSWGLPYAAAMSGAEIVMPGPHLKPDTLAEIIETERITVAAGVPTIWNGLYHDLKSNPRDISCVRSLVVGGSAMPRSLIEAYENELDVSVLHAWGMTELSPLGTVSKLLSKHEQLSKDEQLDVKAKQGYAIGGVEMRIVDLNGNELPWDGETMGELQVRGPWIIKQYFRREPDESYMTKDGWFRTGDVVTIDPDGIMQITDRTKDLVKSGGEWISSVELENALISHPQVMEASVIAIPDEKWSERPLACVVLASDAEVTAEELNEFLAPKFAKFWLPDHYVFVDEIPKTSVGKFDKKVLRKSYSKGELELQ